MGKNNRRKKARKNKNRHQTNAIKYIKVNVPKDIKFDNCLINGTIDAHCWVERKGIIYDPHFSGYNARMSEFVGAARKLRVAPMTAKHYCPAPEETQKLFKAFYMQRWNKTPEFIRRDYVMEEGKCPFNALCEIERRGGKFVFGSMGFGDAKGANIFWEYGGVDYFSTNDFQTGKQSASTAIENWLMSAGLQLTAGQSRALSARIEAVHSEHEL